MLDKVKHEWRLFLIAVGFFTRIPVPQNIFVDQQGLNRASRYFALVGTGVGILSSIVLALSNIFLPQSVAVLLAMVTSVMITGAFHEDGLADTADGLGGGWTVNDKLNIMKDSRLGSYGAIALILSLMLKWQLLTVLTENNLLYAILALILGHTLSRLVAASLMFSEPYVRQTDGKSKPVATEQNQSDLKISCLIGLALLLFMFLLMPWADAVKSILSLMLGLLLLRFLLVLFFRKQIGGYTGDTLGASQQISEIVIYLLLLSLTGPLVCSI